MPKRRGVGETDHHSKDRYAGLEGGGGIARARVRGHGAILSAAECVALVALYSDDQRFRSHIIMGDINLASAITYFANPLPEVVANCGPAYPHPLRLRITDGSLGDDAPRYQVTMQHF
jgi:hypothetical protein